MLLQYEWQRGRKHLVLRRVKSYFVKKTHLKLCYKLNNQSRTSVTSGAWYDCHTGTLEIIPVLAEFVFSFPCTVLSIINLSVHSHYLFHLWTRNENYQRVSKPYYSKTYWQWTDKNMINDQTTNNSLWNETQKKKDKETRTQQEKNQVGIKCKRKVEVMFKCFDSRLSQERKQNRYSNSLVTHLNVFLECYSSFILTVTDLADSPKKNQQVEQLPRL